MVSPVLVSLGATALAPYAGNLLSLDLTGVARILPTLVRVSNGLHRAGRGRDERLARRMVELARDRAPRDTGRLAATGITYGLADGAWYVKASAQRDEGSADYARFVEFDTRAGERGRRITEAVGDGTFARAPFDEAPRRADRTRTRKQARTHPGTTAQPFFWPSVREVLAESRRALTPEMDAIAVGFSE